ncbi:MAG TPA: sugar phosphate isomerase/epimerase family protein [Terriglobia bacterium]|nr:sugar phosphate isomerase/epimerase family protein [Terriglobia bacterium]
MSAIPRRRFLQSCAGALAASASSFIPKAFSASTEPNLSFPSEPRERLAVPSWPFRGYIEAPTNKWARDPKLPGMDLKDFAAMVVKRFNVHNIEPLSEHFSSTEASYLRDFRANVEKAGARVINIAADPRYSFYDSVDALRQKAVGNGKKWIDVALAIGSPSVRLHIAEARHVKPDVERAADSLKRLAEYGAQKNVLVNLENDDNVTEDPFFIVQVIEKVNHPYLHALPDFCNSMLTHDQEFNNRAMDAMFNHAYNISHMKDSEVGDKGKLYTVDVAKCFEIAKANGYRGYFSMEWEGQGEPNGGVQKLIEESLKNLNA